MKQVLFTMALAFTATLCHSQVTTETEYNYIKKGLQTSFDQGLDIKDGYFIKDIGQPVKLDNNAVLVAKDLFRKSDSSIAGTFIRIIVTGTFAGNGTHIFCIPAPNLINKNSYGWEQLNSELSNDEKLTAKKLLLIWLAYNYSLENNKANRLQYGANKPKS